MAAPPNAAPINQIRFGDEALDDAEAGRLPPGSRRSIPCFGDAGPSDGRDSEVGIGRDLLAGLRDGGSTARTSESDTSTRFRPTSGTTTSSEHLGQRTVFPASSSGTLSLCPSLQVNSIAIAAPHLFEIDPFDGRSQSLPLGQSRAASEQSAAGQFSPNITPQIVKRTRKIEAMVAVRCGKIAVVRKRHQHGRAKSTTG
jgi:hypothetical protein